MDEEKNYTMSFIEERRFMQEHMKWLITQMAEAYKEQDSEKFEIFKRNIRSLGALMNSRDRIISEDQQCLGHA